MYKDFLKRGESKIKGEGVFTTITIPAKAPVLEITGNLYHKNNLPDHPTNCQIGNDLFVGPSGGLDDYVNHSCQPNCYLHIVGNRAFLYSIYVIPPSTEITFDYSTSSTDTLEEWNIICTCKSINCRKVISGLQYVDPEIIKIYNDKGMIPLFMKHVII